MACTALAGAGRAQPVGGAGAAATQGARWSTVDMARLFEIEAQPELVESLRRHKLRTEGGAEVARRAVEAGAELVWDSAGEGELGVSPVVWAEPGLALPRGGAVTVLTVDLQKLYENHPKTRVQDDVLHAARDEMLAKAATLREAGKVLGAEHKRLMDRGENAAAAKVQRQIDANEKKVETVDHEAAVAIGKGLTESRAAIVKELAVEVRASARARGVAVVLDVASGGARSALAPVLIPVGEELRPAADGGLREGAGTTPVVRTIDLGRLYDCHPRSLELAAYFKAENDRVQVQKQPLMAKLGALAETERQQMARGDAAGAEKTRRQLGAGYEEVRSLGIKERMEFLKRVKKQRPVVLDEILRVAREAAGRAGATLLLDASAGSHLGVPFIAYAAAELDLTAEVAKELGIALGEKKAARE